MARLRVVPWSYIGLEEARGVTHKTVQLEKAWKNYWVKRNLNKEKNMAIK